MARYTGESKDRVRDAVDMHALVSERTELRRLGSQWMGRCPFHDERTASFSVDVDNKLFNCFGCGEKGDVFHFVEKTQGLDFVQALEWLADRTGVELERVAESAEDERRHAERQRLHALLERAAKFYSAYLWKAAEAGPAREYLRERGLGEAVLREFQVGYAPAAGDTLVRQAAKSGSEVSDLVAAGLARRRDGRVEDMFRGRILFPLADQRGRVLGFAGRALRDGQSPKYLNTSENRAVGFHKGQLLYGLHAARGPAAKSRRFIVVEGYTDVLALRQAGIAEAVAIMGTSLTEQQLKELTRGDGTTIFLALDADNAGKQATSRAAQMVRERQSELRVVTMPGGRDPAEIVTEDGAAAFHALLERAVTVPEFQVRRVLEQADRSSADGADRALADAAALIRAVDQPHMRRHLVDVAAQELGLAPKAVELAVGDGRAGAADRVAPRPMRSPPIRPLAAAARAERVFLSLCLGLGQLGREYLERSRPEHFATDVMREARRHLLVHTGDPLSGLSQQREDVAAAVMEIIQLADESPVADQALRLSWLELERRRLDRDLLSAEQHRDFDRQRELWGERERIRGEINDLMGQTA